MNSTMTRLMPIVILLLVLNISCGSNDTTEILTIEDNISESKLSSASKNTSESKVFTRIWGDPPTLDPHLTGDTTSSAIIVEIFGGLVSFDTSLNLKQLYLRMPKRTRLKLERMLLSMMGSLLLLKILNGHLIEQLVRIQHPL